MADQDDRGPSGSAEVAGGLVSASVTATGEVVEIGLQPKAMRLASDDLAAAIVEAIAAARAEARPGVFPPNDDLAGLRAELGRVGAHAEQRIAELGNLVRDISARVDQR